VTDGVRKRTSRSLEFAGTLLAALAVAFGVRVFLVEPFRIPSESMLPTLRVGDHLFVDKLAYGARIPGSRLRLPALRDPERGEVVVFQVAVDGDRTFPADQRRDLPRQEFVKRIIGLPGDRIDIVDEVVFVNGEPLRFEANGEHFADGSGRALEIHRVALGERRFEVLDDPDARTRAGSFVVEDGRYFVLGDNRDHSMDSRFWGTVRREELEGPAVLLYWSWDFHGGWLDLLRPSSWWSARVRWERVGQGVH